MRRRFALIGLTLLLVPALAAAQSTQLLESLYRSQLQLTNPSAALQKKIESERLRLKQQSSEELQEKIEKIIEEQPEDGSASATDLESGIVRLLENEKGGVTVDLDLLKEEEQSYYIENRTGTGSDVYRTTRTHSELLAQRAYLEERDSSLNELLTLHKDRLSKLEDQNAWEQYSAAFTIGWFLLVIVAVIVIERTIRTSIIARIEQRNRRYFFTKVFAGCVYVILGLWLFMQLSSRFPGFGTSLAIVGAGIAVGLQDVIKDVLGWAVILQKRMFSLGQRVSIGQYTGDVTDISLMRTTLMEVQNSQYPDLARSGQMLQIPNGMVLREPVLNYNAISDFHSAELILTLSVKSDWQKAETILREILDEQTSEFTDRARRQTHSRTHHFYRSFEPSGDHVFMRLTDKGITFMLRFLVPVGQRLSVSSAITRRILERFSKEKDISIVTEPTVVQTS